MKAVVLLSGSGVPEAMLEEELACADTVVSADGGAAHLARLGRMPHVLVGDMDSIDKALLQQIESSGAVIVRAVAAKDETDGQLAVDEAITRGTTELVLLGALGGRVDHLLGNLMLLIRAAMRGVRAVIRDGGCEIFAATGPVTVSGEVGQTVSILPAGCGVSVRYLDGFQFGTREPLPLPIYAPVGVSNVLTAKEAHASVEGWGYIILVGSHMV